MMPGCAVNGWKGGPAPDRGQAGSGHPLYDRSLNRRYDHRAAVQGLSGWCGYGPGRVTDWRALTERNRTR
jgi:hypothetical protein